MKVNQRFRFLVFLVASLALGVTLLAGNLPVVRAAGPDVVLAFDSATQTATFVATQNGNYVFQLTNPGDTQVPASGLTISGNAPSSSSIVSVTPNGGNSVAFSCSNTATSFTCSNTAAIPAFLTTGQLFTVTVNFGSNAPTPIQFTVSAPLAGDANSSDNTITTTNNVQGVLSLNVTFVRSGPLFVNVPITYTVTVTNAGAGTSSGPLFLNFDISGMASTPGFANAGGSNWSCGATYASGCQYNAAINANSALPPLTFTATPTAAGAWSMKFSAAARGNSSAVVSDVGTVATPPDLRITKTMQANYTNRTAGQTYTLSVDNVGGGPTVGTITVTDTLVAGLRPLSATGGGFTCSVSNQTLSCTRPASPQLAAGGNATITVTLTDLKVPGVYAATSTGNGATVSTSNDGSTGNDNSNVQGASGTTVLGADLQITMSLTGPLGVLAANTSYTLTVTNISNTTFPGVGTTVPAGAVVVNTLPAQLQYGGVAVTTGGSGGFTCGAPAGQVLTCTSGGTLAPGQSGTITFGVQALSTAIGATNVVNTATVDAQLDPLSPAPGATGDPTPPATNANNTATNTFAGPVPTPDMSLDATATQAPSPCVAGSNCSFTFKLSNLSDSAGEATVANPISVVITLPSSVSANPISGVGQTTVTGGDATFTCTYSDLTKKVTCTATTGFIRKSNPATFTTNVFAPAQTTPFSVGVGVFGGNDPFPADLSVAGDTKTYSINVGSSDLVITKGTSGTFQIGSDGIFTFTVTNNGNSPTVNPTIVTDALPALVFFDNTNTTTADKNGWDCSLSTISNISCSFPNAIAGGASKTFQVRVFLDPTLMGPPIVSQISNSATVSSVGEVNTSNNTSNTVNVPLTAQPVPALTITNNCTPTSQAIGSTTETVCSMQITNNGTAAAAIPQGAFTLTLHFDPAGLVGNSRTPISETHFTSTYDGVSNVVWTNSTGGVLNIAQGATYTTTFKVGILPGTTVGTYAVQVTGAWASAPAGVVISNPADVSINVGSAPQPDLGIQILPATKNAIGGTTDTYTVRVSNVSTTSFNGTAVTVTTNFTTPITATSASGTNWTCTVASGNATCNRTTTFTLAAGAAYDDITVNVNVATVTSTSTTTQGASISTVTPAAQDTNALNNNASQTTTVTTGPQPDLTISEANPPTFTINVANAFSITVTNSGTAATGTGNTITVTKPLPTGFTVNAGNSGGGFNCVQQSTSAVCSSTTSLAANGTATITLSVTPSQAGSFPNTQVSVTTTATESNTNNNAFTNTNPIVVNGIATLTISKTEQPAGNFVRSQNTGAYRVTVTNTGGAATAGTITITDTLPSTAMSYNSATPVTSGLTIACSGTSTVTCTTGFSIPAGGTLVFDLTVNLLTTGTFTNNISVTGGGFVGPATGSKTTTIDAAPTPNLSISKSAPSTMQVNTPNSFTLTITNTKAVATTGTISVTDNLDSHLQFVSGASATNDITCSASGTAVTCTGTPTLNQNETRVITINVNPVLPGTITNTATVSGGGMTVTNTSNSVSITINPGPPSLSITKTVGSALSAGQNGSFNITVSNATTGGPTTGTITVTDPLPSGLRYVSASGGGFTCTGTVNTASTVTCTRDGSLPLNGGGVATISVTVNPDPAIYQGTTPVTVTNTASVSGGGITGTLSASVQTTVTPLNPSAPASGSFVINPSSAPADNTTLVTLTVTILRANGTAAASDTTVTLAPSPSTGLTITPSISQVTNTSGQAIFQIKSSTAGTYTFGITASNSFGSITFTTGLPTVTFTGSGTAGTTSATTSTVTTNYSSVPADGKTAATITVTLKDASGNLVAGKPVTLSFSPSSTTIQLSPTGAVTSGANGQAVFTVVATAQQGPVTFSASVTDGSIIFINQTVQVTFTAPGTQPVASTTASATAAATQGTLVVIPTGPIVGRVVAWRLRVRTGPGLTYPIIGLLQYGTDVTIIARNQRGTWYLIQLQTGTAWISAAWVRVTRSNYRLLPVTQTETGTAPLVPVPSPLIPQTGQGVGRVNTFLLRVRTGPGTNYPQIGVLQEGTEILLLGISEGGYWYKFKTLAGEAWVSAAYVKVVRINGNRLPTVDAPPLP